MRDGVPMRYFPIGAKADVHVPLRVVEDLEGGTVIELQLAAPLGLSRHRGRRPRDWWSTDDDHRRPHPELDARTADDSDAGWW